jgi:hypothetical protein
MAVIRMVDFNGRVDSFVIPRTANIQQVADLWKEHLGVPADIRMQVDTGNGEDFFWGYITTNATIPYTIRAPNFLGDMRVFPGSAAFEADQITRLLDYKIPPCAKGHASPLKGGGGSIHFDDDLVPLGLKILKQHLFSWNIEGRILTAPGLTTWWIPYHLDRIMSYGHSVNSDIPEDPNEAEFPPTPWPEEVTILVKSHAPPQIPAAPLSVEGAPLALPAPDLPS